MKTNDIDPPVRLLKVTRYQSVRALTVVGLVAIACGLSLWLTRLESELTSPLPVSPSLHFSTALLNRPAPGELPLDFSAVRVPQPVTLGRGQTLGGLLADLGLTGSEASTAVQALSEHLDVRKLRAGEAGAAYFDDDRRLASFELEVRGKGQVEIQRRDQGWYSIWRESQREVKLRQVHGELRHSLEGAIVQAGGPAQLAIKMSDVLQWDIDFNRDLRVGDRFDAVFEEIYLDGDRSGVGRVLALVYENQGKTYEAYRYADKGYYDSEGRPLQKMFLRSPLPFTRITSRFSRSRFHPVLKVNRPHYGVDFGAPRGTPVRSTAGGVVEFAGRKGGAGKMVEVRHSQGFRTLYLHLSGFASGIRKGARVSQGDLVGYVGSTGLSTGPHLDYRVKKNGKYLDPMKLPSTPAEPLGASEIRHFEKQLALLRGALDGDLEALQALLREDPPDDGPAMRQAVIEKRPASTTAKR